MTLSRWLGTEPFDQFISSCQLAFFLENRFDAESWAVSDRAKLKTTEAAMMDLVMLFGLICLLFEFRVGMGSGIDDFEKLWHFQDMASAPWFLKAIGCLDFATSKTIFGMRGRFLCS